MLNSFAKDPQSVKKQLNLTKMIQNPEEEGLIQKEIDIKVEINMPKQMADYMKKSFSSTQLISHKKP